MVVVQAACAVRGGGRAVRAQRPSGWGSGRAVARRLPCRRRQRGHGPEAAISCHPMSSGGEWFAPGDGGRRYGARDDLFVAGLADSADLLGFLGHGSHHPSAGQGTGRRGSSAPPHAPTGHRPQDQLTPNYQAPQRIRFCNDQLVMCCRSGATTCLIAPSAAARRRQDGRVPRRVRSESRASGVTRPPRQTPLISGAIPAGGTGGTHSRWASADDSGVPPRSVCALHQLHDQPAGTAALRRCARACLPERPRDRGSRSSHWHGTRIRREHGPCPDDKPGPLFRPVRARQPERGQNYRSLLRPLGKRTAGPGEVRKPAALAVADAEARLRRHAGPPADDLPTEQAAHMRERTWNRAAESRLSGRPGPVRPKKQHLSDVRAYVIMGTPEGLGPSCGARTVPAHETTLPNQLGKQVIRAP